MLEHNTVEILQKPSRGKICHTYGKIHTLLISILFSLIDFNSPYWEMDWWVQYLLPRKYTFFGLNWLESMASSILRDQNWSRHIPLKGSQHIPKNVVKNSTIIKNVDFCFWHLNKKCIIQIKISLKGLSYKLSIKH